MNPYQPSSFSKDRDLLCDLFFYDKERHVWVYNHDDQVFKVMAACAKLNVPCRNVPKDDPSTVEIDDADWERIFVLPLATDSLSESPSQELPMNVNPSEPVDEPINTQSPLEKRVFKVVKACEKLDLPYQHSQADDAHIHDIINNDRENISILQPATDDPSEPPSQEIIMKMHPSESIDPKTPFETEKHNTETKVRYYRFNGTNDDALEPKAEDILLAAESEMVDEDEQDMEKAVHALAEQTHAAFVAQEQATEQEDHRPSVPSSLVVNAEVPKDRFPKPSESPQKPKDTSMNKDEIQIVKHAMKDKALENKNFGDLSSWEQVLEDRESTLAAREKVLRLRQKDVQDMEDRLHEERKAFNADYEEKKAFLEDKEQRLKKIFERMEEVAYEFRRNTRSEGEAD